MRYILYFLMLPVNLTGIPLLLLAHLLCKGTNLRFKNFCLMTSVKAENIPFLSKSQFVLDKWYGTTLGHAIILREGSDYKTYVHEQVHVHQMEAAQVHSALVGVFVWLLGGSIVLGVIVWGWGVLGMLIANTVTAVLRGGTVLDSVHEEHAFHTEVVLASEFKALDELRDGPAIVKTVLNKYISKPE